MMPGRILFLIGTPLNQRDVERFGLSEASARGHSIVVADLTDLISPRARNRHAAQLAGIDIRRVDRERMSTLGPLLYDADLIVCLLQGDALTRAALPVFRLISRTKTPYLLWMGAPPPGWTRNRLITRLRDSKDSPLRLLAQKDWLNSLLFRMPPSVLGIRPADYIVDSNVLLDRKSRFAGPLTQRIAVHAHDYDIYLRERPFAGPPLDQAVFLDQYLPYHPDFAASGTTSVDPEMYFGALRRFFDRLEDALGMQVVIAAHPRADYELHPGIFGRRRIVTCSTARLVMESRLVISHATSAVNFAVLARKPVVLVMTRDLARTGMELRNVEEMSAATGAPVVAIDDDLASLDFNALLRIDEARYRAMEEMYIRPPGLPERLLWDIVFDAVEANGHLSRARVSAA